MSAAADYVRAALAIREWEAHRDACKEAAIAEVGGLGGEALFEHDGAKYRLKVSPGRQRLLDKELEADWPGVHEDICEAKPSLRLFKAAAAMGRLDGMAEAEAVERYTARGDDYLVLTSG